MRDAKWWMPWRVLQWLDGLNVWCWANLVMWKVYGGRNWQRNTTCVKVIQVDGKPRLSCYCGYWDQQTPRSEAPHA